MTDTIMDVLKKALVQGGLQGVTVEVFERGGRWYVTVQREKKNFVENTVSTRLFSAEITEPEMKNTMTIEGMVRAGLR